MLYILEIPHQRPPHAWVAQDEEDFICTVQDDLDAEGYIFEQATFQDAVEAFGKHELYNKMIFANRQEAEAALAEGWRWASHQGAEAQVELRELIEETV